MKPICLRHDLIQKHGNLPIKFLAEQPSICQYGQAGGIKGIHGACSICEVNAALSLYDLPSVKFKTVSEFRHSRAVPAQPSKDVETVALPVASQPCLPETIPSIPTHINTESIQSALYYFDTECNAATPTAFVAQAQTEPPKQSALAEFMSKAVDIESAFEFAGPALTDEFAAAPVLTLPALSENILAELQEDDGNGLVVPMTSKDADVFQDLLLPDEPSLASSRILEEASVLKDPQEVSSTTCTFEKDQFGRVVKALFYASESVNFQYDLAGELCKFNYAGMDWSKDEAGWTAQDRQTEYFVDARISVLESGAIKIERDDVVRTLKASGTRIDEHKSGSRTESRKLKNKPSPYDLLAKAKAVNSIWLSSTHKASGKTSGEQPKHVPFQLNLVSDVNFGFPDTGEFTKSMIPSIAKAPNAIPSVVNPANISCVPSAPIELRSLERTDKLRSLEEELLDEHREHLTRINWRLQAKECWLKSCLWLTDRLSGQSSPKHLEKLDELAKLYFEQQKNDLAELTHLRALHIREQFFGKRQPELAESVRGLAQIYEARGNYARAEQMYKEAIDLQEGGIRKVLFLYSEKVTDDERLRKQLVQLFSTINDLSQLYLNQGKQPLCAMVYEKALALWDAISEREPNAKPVLRESADKYLDSMASYSK